MYTKFEYSLPVHMDMPAQSFLVWTSIIMRVGITVKRFEYTPLDVNLPILQNELNSLMADYEAIGEKVIFSYTTQRYTLKGFTAYLLEDVLVIRPDWEVVEV